MSELLGNALIPIGALVGLVVALRAQARRMAELAAQCLEEAKVREIRRLLEDRRWYGGELHGVTIAVDRVVDGDWWVSWSGNERAADGLVPDKQLDQELLLWLRGETTCR